MKQTILIIATLTCYTCNVAFAQNHLKMINQLKTILQNPDSNVVLAFVAQNPHVLEEQEEGKTGLMFIAYNRNKDIRLAAAKYKGELNFFEAIAIGNKAEVEKQLTREPDLVNRFSPDGFTPIGLACFFEEEEIATLLLGSGANPNTNANNASKVNALHAAVAKNNYRLCQILIDAGVDVNVAQMENVTPLHSAAHRGNLKIVKLLIEHGANINMKMNNGDTAFLIASRDQHSEVAAYLRQRLE